MSERFLQAYYYAFDATGVDEVDAVLESVARAGKAYHHTQGWSESDGDAPTQADQIQAAANAVAAELRTLRTRLAACELSAEEVEALRDLRAELKEFGMSAPERQYRSRDEEDNAAADRTGRALALLDRLTKGPTP